jgi:peptidoglycan/LPS O-acetylase OafA/YrhL
MGKAAMATLLPCKKKGAKREILDIEEQMRSEIKAEKEKVKRKIIYALALLALIFVSVMVYHFFEGWSWEDSVFFTTSTITTVGYGDIVPKTYYGRLFTIPLMLIGVGVGFYVIYSIQDYGRTKLDSVTKYVDRIGEAILKNKK